MDLEQRIARGMERVPQLPDVTLDKAGPELKPLYQDIEQTLRVPFVNFIYRMLANFPDYFEPAWHALAPGLRTLEFEQAADRLRAAAVPEFDVDTMTGDGLSPVDRQAIVDFTDSIHYVLPKLLLVASCLDLQLDDRESDRSPTNASSHPFERGIAEGTRLVPFVNPAEAKGRVHEIFEDIRTLHQHPGVASYYRGLGNFPLFLDTVWAQVRPHAAADDRRASRQSLLAIAEELAAGFLTDSPRPQAASDYEDVRAVLAVFRYRIIPDLLLDVSLIKSMRDGSEAARRSRFSFA